MVTDSKIEVRYQETDQMGIVYHANYLVWFEIGRTKYTENLGFQYIDMEKAGLIVPVLDVHVQYKYPVKYGDQVTVSTYLIKYDGLRFIYKYEVKVDERICVIGETSHVILKKDNFRPIALKRECAMWHEAYVNAVRS